MSFLTGLLASPTEKLVRKWLAKEGARKVRSAIRHLSREEQLQWAKDLRTLAELLQAEQVEEAGEFARVLVSERVKL